MTTTRSTCPYCGVGCGVLIESEGAQVVGVRGDPEHPANRGRLCSKGSTLHLTASAEVTRQTRLLHPLRRLERGGALQAVSWESALSESAERMANIVTQHGPDAVGFYISGQLLTEDYYVFNKLAKGLIGTNNIDSNSRLCMSSAVAGYKQTLGADAPPACYEDIDHASTLFIVGSNTAFAHPILFRRIEDARAANPALRIIVCDPHRTDTAELADLHLPTQPGTDVMLFNGMLHLMLWEGWIDPAYIEAHTHGFDALKALVRSCTPELVTRTCGISMEALVQATQWFAGVQSSDGQRTPTLSLYCQGLNQSTSGTAKNTALINLHLATGQIGRAGAGPFSLTGQPNAMGGREVGGMANLLSAHRDLSNPQHRAEVAALWGVGDVPSKVGKTAVEMFEAAADGEIKALWIACTNPAQSMPNQTVVRRAMERAEWVVLQEAFATTATARYADVLLPATTWGEKEGTVTNSERRISRVRAAVPAPGAARHDWQIAVDLGRKLEALLPPRTAAGRSLFPYTDAESVWLEHRESTRGRDLDITGLTYTQLEIQPQQWPQPEGALTGRARLYEDGCFATPDQRARFVAKAYVPVAEPRSARYPISLTTGRLRDQWHGMSRTGTLGNLFGHTPEPVLQMPPQDMERRQLQAGDLVYVTSERGSIVVPVEASSDIGLNQAFMGMHWGDDTVSGNRGAGAEPASLRLAGVNTLTTDRFCPDSRQPEFKHTPVKVLKAEFGWRLEAMAWLPNHEALTVRHDLSGLMTHFAFASCTLFATAKGPYAATHTGVMFRAAHHDAAPSDVLVKLLAELQKRLQLHLSPPLRYDDPRRGLSRVIALNHHTPHSTLSGFLLAGDCRSRAWLRTLLVEQLDVAPYGRHLLSSAEQPPVALQSAGRQICTCLGVSEQAIITQLLQCSGSAAQRLDQLQGALRCGTNCGSCLPELRRLVDTTQRHKLIEKSHQL